MNMPTRARAWCGIALLTLMTALCGPAEATDYPVEVVDIAGRHVTLKRAPQRIFLQNGHDILALTLLDREAPFARVVGWENSVDSSDPTMWALIQQRWPNARDVPEMSFDNAGHVDLEALVRLRPELVLLDIQARAAVENGPIGDVFERLGIQTLYVDSSRDPLVNVPKTIALLGRVLDREARAEAYLAFYRQKMATLQAAIAAQSHRPKVFIEIRAGRMGLDQCCFTQGKTSWGHLIAAMGGQNVGMRLLAGATGDISMETLIRIKPDVYLMTGTQRAQRGARMIPFGYHASLDKTHAAMDDLMARRGFRSMLNSPQACVHAFYHEFYNSAFNVVALEYLAQAMYPDAFANLSPDDTYRELIATYTSLPDAPFVFRAKRGYGTEASCG